MGWMNVPREMTQWGEVPLTPTEWLQPSKISQSTSLALVCSWTVDAPGRGTAASTCDVFR